MLDNRKRRRWELIYYLRVFDDRTGAQLGHVVDVSEGGMKLVHPEPIEIGREFDVRMEVPDADGSTRRLVMRARSRWSDADVNVAFRVTGFELIEPSADTVDAIDEIIDALHFNGPPELAARPSTPLRGIR